MMFIEIKQIGVESLPEYDFPEEELDSVIKATKESDPALAFWFRDEPLAILGFIPEGIIAYRAFCWMQTFPAAEKHKLIFGRQAVLFMPEIRKRYRELVGYSKSSSAVRWLSSLGARFGEPIQDGLIPFVIGD